MALTLTPVTATQATPVSGVASSTTSFSPAAGTLVRVYFGWMWSSSVTGPTFTVADSNAVSYTSVVQADDGFVFVAQGIFEHYYATAPGSITIKVTCSNTTTSGCLIVPVQCAGANPTQTGRATNTATGSSSSLTCEVSLTPTQLGSYVMSGGELQQGSTITAAAGNTTLALWNNVSLGDQAGAAQSTSATAALTSTVYGFTQSPANANGFTAIAAEILPAPPAAPPPAPVSFRPPGLFSPAALAPLQPGTPALPTPYGEGDAGLAPGTGTALPPLAAVTAFAGLASGTGTALAPSVTTAGGANAGLASGSGVALQPSVSASGNAPAVLATGSGAALAPAALVQANSGLASGTGTALAPAALVQPGAGLASGTGAASSLGSGWAGLASGTGTALPALPLAQPNAGLASGTGTALAPVVLVQATAGLASGTGAALSPSAASSATVSAGLASGAGTALGPSVATAANVTVTAAASGAGSSNGIELVVRALTHASPTQTGATSSSETVTTPQLAITPGATGNWVYGAVGTGASATAFSSLDANTTSLQASSVVSGAYWGVYRSTAATSTSPTTYGWAAPSAGSGSYFIASAEIQFTGTPAEDASSPATASTSSLKTITTAAFAPPAADVLVAVVVAGWTGSGAVAVALSDSASSYTWTQLVGTVTEALCSVWVGIPKGTTAPAGLASGAGAALSAAALVQPNAGLAAGTGAASSTGTGTAGLAAGTGAALSATALVQPNGGLASGTGAASGTGTGRAGLASGAGTALSPAALVQPNAGIATGTGAALVPTTTGSTGALAGLATGTGAASSTGTGQAGLATGTGTALSMASLAGLAHGAGSAGQPAAPVTAFAGLAHGGGAAFGAIFGTVLNKWGVTFAEPGPNAVLTENAFGGTWTLPGFGGSLSVPFKNAVLTLPGLGGSLAGPARGATLSLANLSAVISEGTMQQASLTLSEFNDMLINIAVTNNGTPYSLTGQNLQLLLKSQAGVPDNTALVFSSSGGSPAIVITSAPGGLATCTIPNASLSAESYNFYRLDVISASLQQQTTVYGPIVWVTL